MPHIHTEPGQHDMTVSAYIIREIDDEWNVLVHLHRKVGKLMQIGGHIELDQTPWQAAVNEVAEESGYELEELKVLQFTADQVRSVGNVTHPQPFASNTHHVTMIDGQSHFHSDSCYGFVATAEPVKAVGDSESADLRWMTLPRLQTAAKVGEALADVATIYEFLIRHLGNMYQIDPRDFSLDKPNDQGITYKR